MRIGVDLGGTKIEAIALVDGGDVRARERVPTPQGDYDATLDAITRLVVGIEKSAGASGTVGIGIPGALSPATGRVKNANSVWLNGQILDKDLERLLERPLRFANDANCFALSEATDGAAAGAQVVFGAILGTGCGGGIVVNGRVLTGPNAIAGESTRTRSRASSTPARSSGPRSVIRRSPTPPSCPPCRTSATTRPRSTSSGRSPRRRSSGST
jgi:fructokinase